MQATLAHIAEYFQKTTTWLFLTLILLVSYALTQAAGSGDPVIFLRFVGSLCMISAPILVWAHYRHSLAGQQFRLLLLGIFSLALLAYGPTIKSLPFTKYLLETDSLANQQSIRGLYGCFLVLLGFLWWNERRGDRKTVNWLNNLPLPWVGAGIALLFSAGLSITSNYYQESIVDATLPAIIGSYLLLVLQVFAIYFSYYLIYHVHHHVLFRRLLPERGLLYYLLGAILLLIVFTSVHGWLISFLPAVRQYYIHPIGLTGAIIDDINLSLSLSVFLFSLPFILVMEWSRKERTLTQLKAEKVASELALLKEQINPHFFFNTLNNLYSLSLKQAPETPDTVLQLSELMRYVIYRAREETVELQEEVKDLKDYLDLQRIRLYQDADIEFTVSMENPELKIPPLLFIILVENAFKHGIEPAVGECFLELKLTEIDGEITFLCRNSVDTKAAATVRSGGIGLQNLHRRLELLYPDSYDLQVDAQAEEYRVLLSLWGDTPLPLEKMYMEELVPNLDEQLL